MQSASILLAVMFIDRLFIPTCYLSLTITNYIILRPNFPEGVAAVLAAAMSLAVGKFYWV
jgi:hypothetical protein